MTAPLLQVEDLKIHLGDRDGLRVVRAVDGVSFAVRQGETVGLVGESGSGKTMTALAIPRLLPAAARHVTGRVLFSGQNLLEEPEHRLRERRGRDIALILQDPMVALDPVYTIGNQLAEPLRIHRGLSGAALKTRCIELLQAVGIPSPERRLDQYPYQMSGGMLQRVVAAIAMSCEPRLIIADEPTTALDPTVQAQMLDLLDELKSKTGLALLIVTHDFGVVARLCDRVLVMYAGRIVESGPVRQIFDHPRHPYTRALLDSIPGAAERKRLRTIDGQPPDLADLPPGCAFAPRCADVQSRCRVEAPPETRFADGQTARCWLAEAS